MRTSQFTDLGTEALESAQQQDLMIPGPHARPRLLPHRSQFTVRLRPGKLYRQFTAISDICRIRRRWPTVTKCVHSHYQTCRPTMPKATESQKYPLHPRRWWEVGGYGRQIETGVWRSVKRRSSRSDFATWWATGTQRRVSNFSKGTSDQYFHIFSTHPSWETLFEHLCLSLTRASEQKGQAPYGSSD